MTKKYIELGEFKAAGNFLNIGQFAFVGIQTDQITFLFLKAKVNQEMGNKKNYEKYKRQAKQKSGLVGLYGPGTFGELYYAPRLFLQSGNP